MAHTLAPALTRLTANIGVEVHGLDLGRSWAAVSTTR